MKMLWCWRCQMDIPMLDEVEFEQVASVMRGCWSAAKQQREAHTLPVEQIHATLFAPALAEYRRLTGFDETNHVALYHHRISLYGPPCTSCGKPMRTPAAQRCAACGASREHA